MYNSFIYKYEQSIRRQVEENSEPDTNTSGAHEEAVPYCCVRPLAMTKTVSCSWWTQILVSRYQTWPARLKMQDYPSRLENRQDCEQWQKKQGSTPQQQLWWYKCARATTMSGYCVSCEEWVVRESALKGEGLSFSDFIWEKQHEESTFTFHLASLLGVMFSCGAVVYSDAEVRGHILHKLHLTFIFPWII